MILAISLLAVFNSPLLCQVNRLNSDNDVFPTPPGVLTRPLEQAKQALANEDYQTAIEQLEPLLGLQDNGPFEFDDYLLFDGKRTTNNSLRNEASRLLSNMPTRGLQVFELKHGIAAKKKLVAAVAADDDSLLEVSQKYFHTKAGYTATFLAAQKKLAQGDFAFACNLFQKLVRIESSKSMFDPDLSVQYAVALACDDRIQDGVTAILGLKERHPNLQFLFAGKIYTHTLTSKESTEGLLKDLVLSLKTDVHENQLLSGDWLTHRSVGRRPSAIAEFPLPIPEWTVPISGLKNKSTIEKIRQQKTDDSLPLIPARHSIAVKGSIITRSLDQLIAVDANTGKRIWTYPWSEQPKGFTEDEPGYVFERKLRSNLWSHQLSGQLTSDGQNVYFVESPEPPDSFSPNTNFGSTPIYNGNNSLVALRIIDEAGKAVQGQLAWRVDSSNSKDRALYGCVFLGPPLIRDQTAYVIIERSSQIRLAALDAKTGKSIWSQQIASTQSSDGFDQQLFRHRKAATPVYSRGLLICPTMVGGLVAIDLATRNLKWGMRYSTISVADYRAINDGSVYRFPWHDDALFEVGEDICFSPIDSKSYYVIKIETGSIRNTEPKGKDLFVAGQFNGRLVVVGQKTITLDSAKGISTHKISIGEYGAPTGTGFFADKFYFLPVTGKKILKIDLDSRKVIEIQQTETELGNLCFYQGRLISQTVQHLASFWFESHGQKVADRLLAARQNDPAGQLITAQILQRNGKIDEAIDAATVSLQSVSNKLTHEFLTNLLVTKIQSGDAIDWKKIDASFSLLQDPAHRRKFLLAKIEHQLDRGKSEEAVNHIMSLVKLYSTANGAENDTIQLSNRLSISGLRLIRSRLKRAVAAFDNEQKKQFQENLSKRFAIAIASEPLDQVRILAEIFGEFDFTKSSTLELANRMISTKHRTHLLWMEAVLMESLDSESSPEQRVNLYEALISIYSLDKNANSITKQKIIAANRHLLRLLQAKSSNDNSNLLQQRIKSIQKLIADLDSSNRKDHPDGRTRIDLQKDSAADLILANHIGGINISQNQYTKRLGEFRLYIGADFGGTVIIKDQFGNVVYQDSSRRSGSRHANTNYQQTRYQVLGDLLVLSFGYDHIGIDLSKIYGARPDNPAFGFDNGLVGDSIYEGEKAILWRYDAFKHFEGAGLTKLSRESNELDVVNSELVDNSGNRIGKTTFLSSEGICILKLDSLDCLDPWTGKTLWSVDGIAAGSDLIGDGKHVYVFQPDDKKVDVFKQLDGEKIAELAVPPQLVNRFFQAGSKVVSLRENENNVALDGFNLSPNGIAKEWSHEFSAGTKATYLKAALLGTVSKSGQLSVVNLMTGKETQKIQLDLTHTFSTVQAVPFGNEFLLILNKNSRNKIESKRFDFSSRPDSSFNIRGSMHLIGESGVQWTSPAMIDDYDFILNQPAAAPVFLLRQQNKQRNLTDFIFIRRSDGSLIDYSSSLKLVEPTSSVRYSHKANQVIFNVGFNWLRLHLTDYPRPVEAPARTGRYSSRFHLPAVSPPDQKQDDDFFSENEDRFADEEKKIKKWIEFESRRSPFGS